MVMMIVLTPGVNDLTPAKGAKVEIWALQGRHKLGQSLCMRRPHEKAASQGEPHVSCNQL